MWSEGGILNTSKEIQQPDEKQMIYFCNLKLLFRELNTVLQYSSVPPWLSPSCGPNFCPRHWTDLHVWGPNCWPLFSAGATVCRYRLLQKLPLWPAVIPDHKSPTPQTKWWWMRQQIHSIKQDIAYSCFPALQLVLDQCISACSFHVSSAVSSWHSTVCWINSVGLQVWSCKFMVACVTAALLFGSYFP